MTVERSGRGALTTNADYTLYQENWTQSRSISSGQWHIENNQIISYDYYFDSSTLGDNFGFKVYEVSLSAQNTNNDELLYSVSTRQYNSGSPVTVGESSYSPVNSSIPSTSSWQYQTTSRSNWYACRIYLKRADGGILTPSDMYTSLFQIICQSRVNVSETTAIPQNWLETTTASFQNPMDTYTTIIPTDFDISSSQYDPLLEIPSKIDTAINFIILGFGRIMNFRYISFVVCFVLIVGLVAWLIH